MSIGCIAAAVSAFDDEEAPEMMQAAADLCATNGALFCLFWQNLGSLLLGLECCGTFLACERRGVAQTTLRGHLE
jgi:hypothetical protein